MARRRHGPDLAYRAIGTVDLLTGRGVSLGHRHRDLSTLVRLYPQVGAASPHAERISVVHDNWPVPRPQNWPSEPSRWAQQHWGNLPLPIRIVPVPTYASWLNSIAKRWRWLKQVVPPRPRLAGDSPALRAAVQAFLAQFAAGSADVLRYVGLATTELFC